MLPCPVNSRHARLRRTLDSGHALSRLWNCRAQVRSIGSQIPDDIEIRNCHLSNFQYGIYVESGTNLVVRDNDSSENYDDTNPTDRSGVFLGMVEGGGIRLNKVLDALIASNTTNRQAIGIDLRDSCGSW